jgi:hypothetical protein
MRNRGKGAETARAAQYKAPRRPCCARGDPHCRRACAVHERRFPADFTNHLWLVWVQQHAIEHGLFPTLNTFVAMSVAGLVLVAVLAIERTGVR